MMVEEKLDAGLRSLDHCTYTHHSQLAHSLTCYSGKIRTSCHHGGTILGRSSYL